MKAKPGFAMHVIVGFRRGGAERMLLRTVVGLRDLGWRASVVGLRGGPMMADLEAAGVTVCDLGMARRGVVAAIRSLVAIVRRDRPDVLHSWMFHANLPSRVAGRFCGVPLVVSSERTLEQESWRRYLANRLTGRLPHVHACVSEAVADFAHTKIGLPLDRLVVIRNGIDTEAFARNEDRAAIRKRLGIPPDRPLVGCVAQLKSVKRIDVLLEAFARVELPAELVLVGDGVERESLEALSRRLAIADRVRFCGEQSDPRPWLHALDVFALASDVEGLPVAAIEAMAAGLPVVATGVGGVPEVVRDGVTGLLVPCRDPEALGAALRVLLKDRERAAEMGARGRKRVCTEFDERRMVSEVEELYRSRLGDRR